MTFNNYCAHKFCMPGIQKDAMEVSSLCFVISIASVKGSKGRGPNHLEAYLLTCTVVQAVNWAP